MATTREQIEHLEYFLKDKNKPWKKLSYSRKWLKRQMNRFIRRKNKKENYIIDKKQYYGWEY